MDWQKSVFSGTQNAVLCAGEDILANILALLCHVLLRGPGCWPRSTRYREPSRQWLALRDSGVTFFKTNPPWYFD
jgi:hypothetical protein